MVDSDIKNYIDDHLPIIDEHLSDLDVPIYDRYLRASHLFVEYFVVSTSVGSKKDFLASKGFYECIIPLVKNWYDESYESLAENPKSFILQGLITIREQPTLLKFPSSISIVEEEGKSAWLKFVDHLDSTENIQEMIQGRSISLDKLDKPHKENVEKQISILVSRLRSISINLNVLTIDEITWKMARSIVGHFEKATMDIVSYDSERVATACWEIHLAIEKVFKVYLKQKTGRFKQIHSLNDLYKSAVKETGIEFAGVDRELVNSLPKNAISLRYAESTIAMMDAIDFYNKGLLIVNAVSDELDREYNIANSVFLINKPTWVK
ncbi:HEPN domain-containing protein [Pseudoalteromonas sp.]|uniref:HEPN domain-containing protein n=1 Tax=Pseudoalteromonas sp. TaxID=53249 RepID=UPI0023577F42|nr:HEPN domain-containing protein [Pseudoalteromonas sp.]